MQRTNIYLTEREQAAIDARARLGGCSRSEVIRSIIDRELGLDQDEVALAALRGLGTTLDELSSSLFADDADLSID